MVEIPCEEGKAASRTPVERRGGLGGKEGRRKQAGKKEKKEQKKHFEIQRAIGEGYLSG